MALMLIVLAALVWINKTTKKATKKTTSLWILMIWCSGADLIPINNSRGTRTIQTARNIILKTLIRWMAGNSNNKRRRMNGKRPNRLKNHRSMSKIKYKHNYKQNSKIKQVCKLVKVVIMITICTYSLWIISEIKCKKA